MTSVPSVFALRISSRPPCSCTSALAIGRPSPVPSRQRERLASTWPNGVSATAISSPVMPKPVSRTRTVAPPPAPVPASIVTEPPGGVNLRALPIRLVNTWRSFAGSPFTMGRCRSIWPPSVIPTSTAVGLKEASAAWRISSSSTSPASSVYLPLCILDMSRMSLMTASRCVAASRMRSAYSTTSASARARFWCSPSSLAKPITVLRGVLSSWLMLAMNSDLTVLASWVSIRAVCSANQALCRNTESASSDEYSAIRDGRFTGPAVPLNMIRTEDCTLPTPQH